MENSSRVFVWDVLLILTLFIPWVSSQTTTATASWEIGGVIQTSTDVSEEDIFNSGGTGATVRIQLQIGRACSDDPPPVSSYSNALLNSIVINGVYGNEATGWEANRNVLFKSVVCDCTTKGKTKLFIEIDGSSTPYDIWNYETMTLKFPSIMLEAASFYPEGFPANPLRILPFESDPRSPLVQVLGVGHTTTEGISYTTDDFSFSEAMLQKRLDTTDPLFIVGYIISWSGDNKIEVLTIGDLLFTTTNNQPFGWNAYGTFNTMTGLDPARANPTVDGIFFLEDTNFDITTDETIRLNIPRTSFDADVGKPVPPTSIPFLTPLVADRTFPGSFTIKATTIRVSPDVLDAPLLRSGEAVLTFTIDTARGHDMFFSESFISSDAMDEFCQNIVSDLAQAFWSANLGIHVIGKAASFSSDGGREMKVKLCTPDSLHDPICGPKPALAYPQYHFNEAITFTFPAAFLQASQADVTVINKMTIRQQTASYSITPTLSTTFSYTFSLSKTEQDPPTETIIPTPSITFDITLSHTTYNTPSETILPTFTSSLPYTATETIGFTPTIFTPTYTVRHTESLVPTFTPTPSPGPTTSLSDTVTATEPPAVTITRSTHTMSAAPTLSGTFSVSSSWIPTSSHTKAPTLSRSSTGTSTFTDLPTPSSSMQPTFTFSGTASKSVTTIPTLTLSPSPTETLSFSRSPSLQPTHTGTLPRAFTATFSPSPTLTVTSSLSVSPTHTETGTTTHSLTLPPSITMTPHPTLTQTTTARVTPTLTASRSVSLSHTGTATLTESATFNTSISLTVIPTKTFTAVDEGTMSHSTTHSPSWWPTVTLTTSRTFSDGQRKSYTFSETPTESDPMLGTISKTNSATLTVIPTSSYQTPTITVVRPTLTDTFTPTATERHTPLFSQTESITGNFPPTETPTYSPTLTFEQFTVTPNVSVTPTATEVITPTAFTNTSTQENTPTLTPTNANTNSLTETFTPTIIASTSVSPTTTETATPSLELTYTRTQSTTVTTQLTNTPTATTTFTVTSLATQTSTHTHSTTPFTTLSVTKGITSTPSLSSTGSVSLTISTTPSPRVTNTPSLRVTDTPTFSLTLTPSPDFSSTPSVHFTRTSTATQPTITTTFTSTPTLPLSLTPSKSMTFTPSTQLTTTLSSSWTTTQSTTFTPSYLATLSPTDSLTPTFSATGTPSLIETMTPSWKATSTLTNTWTPSWRATQTLTQSTTRTPSPQDTATPSDTGSITESVIATSSRTMSTSMTNSVTGSLTNSPVESITLTPSVTQTVTPTSTPSTLLTATPTTTQTPSYLPTDTLTVNISETESVTGSNSMTDVITETRTPTGSFSTTPAVTTTTTASPTPSPEPTTTPSLNETLSLSLMPTLTLSPHHTLTNSPKNTPTISFSPTLSLSYSTTPTPDMSGTPSVDVTATLTPTATDTDTVLHFTETRFTSSFTTQLTPTTLPTTLTQPLTATLTEDGTPTLDADPTLTIHATVTESFDPTLTASAPCNMINELPEVQEAEFSTDFLVETDPFFVPFECNTDSARAAISYDWHCVDVDLLTGDSRQCDCFLGSPVESGGCVYPDSSSLLIPSFTLITGHSFKFTVVARQTNVPVPVQSVAISKTVVHPVWTPLQAAIKGGSRFVSIGDEFTVESVSRDPSGAPWYQYVYMWTICRVVDSSVTIQCSDTVLADVPPPLNQIGNVNRTTFTLTVGNENLADTTWRIQLTYQHTQTGRSDVAWVLFTFVTEPTPTVTVNWLGGGDGSSQAAATDVLILRPAITNRGDVVIQNQQQSETSNTTTPFTNSDFGLIKNSWVFSWSSPDLDLTSEALGGTDTPELGIPASALLAAGKSDYRFRLTITDSSTNQVIQTSETIVPINQPPQLLESILESADVATAIAAAIDIQPTDVQAAITTMRMTITKIWRDVHSLTSIRFAVRMKANPTVEIPLQPVDSAGLWTVVSSAKTTISSVAPVFPVLNVERVPVELIIYIRDSKGVIRELKVREIGIIQQRQFWTVSTITAYMMALIQQTPTISTTTQVSYLLDMVSSSSASKFHTLHSSGSKGSTAMQVEFGSTVLQHQQRRKLLQVDTTNSNNNGNSSTNANSGGEKKVAADFLLNYLATSTSCGEACIEGGATQAQGRISSTHRPLYINMLYRAVAVTNEFSMSISDVLTIIRDILLSVKTTGLPAHPDADFLLGSAGRLLGRVSASVSLTAAVLSTVDDINTAVSLQSVLGQEVYIGTSEIGIQLSKRMWKHLPFRNDGTDSGVNNVTLPDSLVTGSAVPDVSVTSSVCLIVTHFFDAKPFLETIAADDEDAQAVLPQTPVVGVEIFSVKNHQLDVPLKVEGVAPQAAVTIRITVPTQFRNNPNITNWRCTSFDIPEDVTTNATWSTAGITSTVPKDTGYESITCTTDHLSIFGAYPIIRVIRPAAPVTDTFDNWLLVALIAGGVFVLLIILLLLIFCCCCKNRSAEKGVIPVIGPPAPPSDKLEEEAAEHAKLEGKNRPDANRESGSSHPLKQFMELPRDSDDEHEEDVDSSTEGVQTQSIPGKPADSNSTTSSSSSDEPSNLTGPVNPLLPVDERWKVTDEDAQNAHMWLHYAQQQENPLTAPKRAASPPPAVPSDVTKPPPGSIGGSLTQSGPRKAKRSTPPPQAVAMHPPPYGGSAHSNVTHHHHHPNYSNYNDIINNSNVPQPHYRLQHTHPHTGQIEADVLPLNYGAADDVPQFSSSGGWVAPSYGVPLAPQPQQQQQADPYTQSPIVVGTVTNTDVVHNPLQSGQQPYGLTEQPILTTTSPPAKIQLVARQKYAAIKGRLGLKATVTDGILKVIHPRSNGPASRAGVQLFDHIISLDGTDMNNQLSSFQHSASTLSPGQIVTLTVSRRVKKSSHYNDYPNTIMGVHEEDGMFENQVVDIRIAVGGNVDKETALRLQRIIQTGEIWGSDIDWLNGLQIRTNNPTDVIYNWD